MQNYLLLFLVVLLIAIHFCMVLWTLTSSNFNRLARIVTKSPPITRSVHRFVPFISYLWNLLEPCSRSVCWPTKPFMKDSLFIFTPCLSNHSYPIHWDRTKVLVCWSPGSRPTLAQELFTLVLYLFGTTSHCLSVQLFQLLPSRIIWRYMSLTWPFPLRHQYAR